MTDSDIIEQILPFVGKVFEDKSDIELAQRINRLYLDTCLAAIQRVPVSSYEEAKFRQTMLEAIKQELSDD